MLNKTLRSTHINNYAQEIIEGNAAVFIGAGLSMGCGFPSWNQLLESFAAELSLPLNNGNDPLSLAQFYENSMGGRGRIGQKIASTFCRKVASSKNHSILASLPIKFFWTTNYDHLIEDSLVEARKIVDVKRDQKSLSYAVPKRDAIVYKMHGDMDSPGNVILTRNDYEDYHRSHELFAATLQVDFLTKTFLFLGFGLEDQNFCHIISRLKTILGKNLRPHYYILKKANPRDFDTIGEYNNSLKKQALWIEDLKRYALYPILIEDYCDIEQVLLRIKRLVYNRSIFISGAAAQYTPISSEAATNFLQVLSYELAKRGNKIVSGYGLGVGPYIVNGALTHAYSSGGNSADHYLITRPFPQNCIKPGDLSRTWTQHRQEMLSQAGIALFLFGNQNKDGEIINSEGMMEEFKLAHKNGLTVIPVSCTGYMSQQIWGEVLSHSHAYYADTDLFNEIKILNNVNFKEEQPHILVNAICETIKYIQNTETEKYKETDEP